MKKKMGSIMLTGLMSLSLAVGGPAAFTAPCVLAADASTEAAAVDPSSADYVIEEDPRYNVPTDELLKQFPIEYQTPAESEMSQKIQNRMLNGFNQWNQGFDAWKNWGNVLYYDGSIYNVHGVKLTLQEYQQAMGISLQKVDIQMGNFRNMVLVDDWMAIQYEITTDGHPGTTMELARFKDFGSRGVKVDEGWGGIKGNDYDGMQMFQTDEEKAAQKEFIDGIINTELKDTDDLDEKYPVEYPTTLAGEKDEQMKELILQDIDSWNKGYDEWSAFAEEHYTEDGVLNLNNQDYDRSGFEGAMKDVADKEDVKRVRVLNVLTSEDWTAVHLWNVITGADGEKTAADTMAFYHFNDDMQIDQCFVSENL